MNKTVRIRKDKENEIELLKIQVYSEYCNSMYGNLASYVLGATVAFYITIMGLYLQKSIDLITYYVFLFVPFPLFIFLLLLTYRRHEEKLKRVDQMIELVKQGQPLPSIENMLKRKSIE
jgi:hypothetical protein